MQGSLDGVDMVFSALGKTFQSDKVDRRLVDVDVEANANLYAEAKRTGVQRFGLTSVGFASASHPVSMMALKSEAEERLEASGLPFLQDYFRQRLEREREPSE